MDEPMPRGTSLVAERWAPRLELGVDLMQWNFQRQDAGSLPDHALFRRSRDSDTWVVVLHGHGSGADQLFTRQDLRSTWLPALDAAGVGLLCPNTRGNAWMSPGAAADLLSLIQALRQREGAGNVVLLGGSMGGTGALIFSALYPQWVQGCVAICPATDLTRYAAWCQARQSQQPILGQIRSAIAHAYDTAPEAIPAGHRVMLQAERLTMPLYIAHDQGDAIIPASESEQLAERLRAAGAPARCVIRPGGNHDSALPLAPDGLRYVLSQIGATFSSSASSRFERTERT